MLLYAGQVVQFMQAPEYSKFTRIIFDTAPTVLPTPLPFFLRNCLFMNLSTLMTCKSLCSHLPCMSSGTYIALIVFARFSGRFNR